MPDQPEELGLDAVDDEAIITLIDPQGREFEVTRKQASISKMVKSALEDDPDAKEIVFKDHSDKFELQLELIAEYMRHHNGVEPELVIIPIRSRRMADIAGEWDAKWIDEVGKDKQKLYWLCESANYVNIESLLRLATCKVATFIKGQPIERYKECLTPEGKKDAVAQEEEKKE